MEFLRRIYENGKITIPKEVRDLLDLQEGDLVKLQVVKVFPASAARPRPAAASPAGAAEAPQEGEGK